MTLSPTQVTSHTDEQSPEGVHTHTLQVHTQSTSKETFVPDLLTSPQLLHFHSPDKFNSQAQICYTAGAILFHQDILTL